MRRDKIVCTLGVCANLAGELVQNLSVNTTAIDLCEDFEPFVCNGWRGQHPRLSPHQDSIDMIDLTQDKVVEIFRGYLEASTSPIDTPDDQFNFALAKKVYENCKDEAEIKRQGVRPLVNMLEEVVTAFPLRSENSTHDFAEIFRFLFLHRVYSGIYFGVMIHEEKESPSMYVLAISAPPVYSLPVEYYSDNKTTESYISVVADTLAKLHPDKNARQNATRLARQLVEFQKALVAQRPNGPDPNYIAKSSRVPLADLATLAPELGLDVLVKSLLPSIHLTNVTVNDPDNIKMIADLYSHTTREVMQTYFIWQVIEELSGSIIAPEIKPWQQFDRQINGRTEASYVDRAWSCANDFQVPENLGWILGRFYLNEYYPEINKKTVESMTTNLKQEYRKIISSNPWLEASVKSKALLKIDKMVISSEYPNSTVLDLGNATSVRDIYRGYNSTSSYFNDTRAQRVWMRQQDLKALATPYQMTREWYMPPQIVSWSSEDSSNSARVTAAMLQPPLFHSALPSYYNFGTIGFILACQVAFAINTYGRLYNENGQLGDWWTNATEAEYKRRSQCFLDQYGNFTIDGLDDKPMHVNSQIFVEEAIGNSAAIDGAFLAWQQRRIDHPETDADLPGLQHWTHEQLFFIAYANSFCSGTSKEAAVSRALSGDYGMPKPLAIKGTLQNSQFFRQHFGCKVKESTCKMW